MNDVAANVAIDVGDDAPISIDSEVDASVGEVIHPFEGPCSKTGWCWTNPLPFGDGARDIYKAPSGTVWVLGTESLHRLVGTVWTTYWLDDPPVAMAGAGEQLFLVGKSIVTFDGAQFRRQPTPTPGTGWHGVAARSETDVVAVGDEGTVIRFDGHAWTTLPTETTERMLSVAIVSDTELWIGGTTHRWHFASGVWDTMAAIAPVTSMATDGTHVWASTSRIELLVSGKWLAIADRPGRLQARALDDLVVGGSTLERFHAGKHDILRTALTGYAISAIDARSLDDVWIGSEGSLGFGTDLVHGPADAFVPVTTTAGTANWWDVFGRNENELFAIGADAMMQFDGKAWRSIAAPKGGWNHGTVSPEGQMFLAEEKGPGLVHGRVFRRDGDGFVDLGYPGTVAFDLWSPDAKTLYVAGGTANYRWDGAWTKLDGLGSYGVSGSTAHDVWFVWDALVTHYDGMTASSTTIAGGSFGAVSVQTADDVWATSSALKGPTGSIVAHFDGAAWSTFPLMTQVIDTDSDPTNLWVVGDGTLIHGTSETWTKELLAGSRAIYAHTAKQQHVVGFGGVARRRIEP